MDFATMSGSGQVRSLIQQTPAGKAEKFKADAFKILDTDGPQTIAAKKSMLAHLAENDLIEVEDGPITPEQCIAIIRKVSQQFKAQTEEEIFEKEVRASLGLSDKVALFS